MSLEVRQIDPGEVRAFGASVSVPFLDVGNTDAIDHWAMHVEADRSWVAVDDGRLVANATVFSRTVTVPGTADGPCPVLPMAAISGVGVHPTHRRRGILRRLMAAMLDQARQRGEALAGLVASEAGIYGRFGFGLATVGVTVTVPTAASRFASPAPAVALRLMDAEEAGNDLPDLFERLRRLRAGQVDRNAATWSTRLADRRREPGTSAISWVIGRDGFASYRFHPYATEVFHQARLEVIDLLGATAEIEAGLWRFLLDIDLVTEVTAARRPLDDPLRWRLADPRQAQTKAVTDALWLRVLDLPVALRARSYRCSARLVLDVTGPDDPADRDVVIGRWRLDAGPDGVSVRRAYTGEATDLELGVADLGALYLGGVTATTLASAGRIVEGRPGALADADRLFATVPAPMSSTGF